MSEPREQRYTFRIPNDFDVAEHDALVVLLHQHGSRVEDDVHRDAAAVLHTVIVFLQNHATAIATGAALTKGALGLANAIINWRRERAKRAAEDKAKAAAESRLVVVAPDQTQLQLLTATDDEVRNFFSRNLTAR